ncbi:molybdate ABC transporter substrate-binding protein [Tessaracoccus flavescens]|uniref:Molybdate ABC transporter substrate-binding protein n=2 Tax=Tessaracoccus flavescens TaxID=399497 RepID=A0A1Q2CVJ4_9ACTN|nr:molybdate ABC transporter substrate-binding protein [Tessaracoccus flavescens]AQP50133.1 molybdate ABC transporter substrate-binding protein [Tessaracoccus flavescens]
MRRAALVVATILLTACGQMTANPGGGAGGPEAAPVTVFAAASLHKAFPEVSVGMRVDYSFDGSSGLVDQLRGGTPADVFASADSTTMDRAMEEGLIDGEPVMFATNRLVLVTPQGNPAGVTGFDSSLAGTRLVVCAPEVPCGAATLGAAERSGLGLAPVSEESSVTDVLGKVTSGEADAGVVYATDAAQAGDRVKTFDVPGADEEPNTYWIAVLADAPNPEGAEAFVELVLGPGQAALSANGFGGPT